MRYGIWFVRFLFAAWMIPAGLNHFIPLFPQPMGSQPLSQELIHALIDSGMFHLVKAVELLAGIGVLVGFRTVLSLVVCLPVSFGVFYWDAPLEGWGSRAALFGYATLLCNSLLCLAYVKSYSAMFTLRTQVQRLQQPVMAARLLFGAWMLLNGANYLFLSLWQSPMGSEPLAVQLMTALVNSRLLDVAMALQMLAGALLLAGVLVPLALCALMPISSCALFWALVLDQSPLVALLALVAFALNGALMLAYLPWYRGVLEPRPLAFGETSAPGMSFDNLFTRFSSSVTRTAYIPAAVTVIAAIAFFGYYVTGRTAQFCMLMLLYPAFLLLAGRLRDMGKPAWLVAPPLVLALANFAMLLGYAKVTGHPAMAIHVLAVAVCAGYAVWAAVGKEKA